MRACPTCETGVNLNARFCHHCGTVLECPDMLAVCPQCKAFMIPDANFCDQCGTSMPLIPSMKPWQSQYMIYIQPDFSVTGTSNEQYYQGLSEPVSTIEEINRALSQYYFIRRGHNLWLGEFVERPNMLSMTPIIWNETECKYTIDTSNKRENVGYIRILHLEN